MKLKLNEQGYDVLKDKLTNSESEGPFSKTTNAMLALDLMVKGQELTLTQVTKAHLANIIKILCTKLKWKEKPEKETVSENENLTNSTNVNGEKEKEETHSNGNFAPKKSEKICQFYRKGKCRHGRSGKTKDQNGKSCEYSHPPTCKKFELYGYKEGGCKEKECSRLHMSLCKMFMKQKICNYGEKCKFLHPRKLKTNDQHRNIATRSGKSIATTYSRTEKQYSSFFRFTKWTETNDAIIHESESKTNESRRTQPTHATNLNSCSHISRTDTVKHIALVHEGNKPFRCKSCGCKLKKHIASVHEVCHVNQLKEHIASVYEGKKPFKCEICNHTVSKKGNVSVTNLVNFECEKCSSKFDHVNQLEEHIASVHEEMKPAKCEICNYTVSKNDNMSVNNLVKFECKKCGSNFDYIIKLKELLHQSMKKRSQEVI